MALGDVNAESLAEAMLGLARNEEYRRELQVKGLERAREFSAVKSAQRIDGLLDALLRAGV